MKILFVATDKFAIPTLAKLLDAPGYEIAGVVTQPDRPAGRQKLLTAPAVKQFLLERQIQLPVYQPEKLRQAASGILEQTQPELIIVAAYGQMIPEVMLNYPRYKCLNIHGSLLPTYRGAVPIEMALLNGDKVTGVSILQMTPELDDGPVLAEAEIQILASDDAISLRTKLAELGAQLLYDILPNWVGGSLTAQEQEQLASKTGRKLSTCKISDLSRARAQIMGTDTVETAINKIRAFAGSGNAWLETLYRGKLTQVKIIAAQAQTQDKSPATSKELGQLSYENKQLILHLTDGQLIITKLQLPGKTTITGKAAGFLVK